MTRLFDDATLATSKPLDKLPFECEWCHKTFTIETRWINSDVNLRPRRNRYCSKTCVGLSTRKNQSENCGSCSKSIYVSLTKKRKSKSGLSFCSRSCAATYNNAHKSTGTRRSKLECWLEDQLTITYPDLEIIYNHKKAINSELDIYIPSLKLAFELNGIFHYEPIYGQEKLSSIQNNDNRKFQACLEKSIELVIMDVSSLIYFKPANAEKYLIIIKSVIGDRDKV